MRLLFVPLITLIITGCDSSYRYPCQDPANWGKLECNNEVCKAEGICTEDTLGNKPVLPAETESNAPSSDAPAEVSVQPLEETTSTCAPVISNDNDPIAKVHNKKPNRNEAIVLDSENDGQVRTPNSLEEEVLTMNTVVDTAAHNAAIK